jgi:hypothetical protein
MIADAPPPAWAVRCPTSLAPRRHAADRIEEPDDRLIGDLIVKLLGDRGIAVAARRRRISGSADRTQLCRRSAGRRRLDRAMLSHHAADDRADGARRSARRA